MDKKNEDLLIKAFEEVNQNTRDFILEGDLQENIVLIEKKYALEAAESQVIQTESLAVLLNMTAVDSAIVKMRVALKKREPNNIEKILSDVETLVFSFK